MIIVAALYGISALTDALDGYIARKLNQQTAFGEYFDPLADKILVLGMFTVFIFIDGLMIPFWLIIFIYLRDIAITFIRSSASKNKIEFKTSKVAKTKTLVQMIVIALIIIYMLVIRIIAGVHSLKNDNFALTVKKILPNQHFWISFLPLCLTVLAVAFTIYTGIDYYIKYLAGKNNERKNN